MSIDIDNTEKYQKAKAGMDARKMQHVKQAKSAKRRSAFVSVTLTLLVIVVVCTAFGLVNDKDGTSYLSGAIYWTLHLPGFGDIPFVHDFASTFVPFSSPIQQAR